MKIAIATNDYTQVSGHAGQARDWLLYDSDAASDEPERIRLSKAQVFHNWEGEGTHPLDEVAVIVAASAGEGVGDIVVLRDGGLGCHGDDGLQRMMMMVIVVVEAVGVRE